jgi:hypothetical protein
MISYLLNANWYETRARPDFVVSRRGRPSDCLVVETMGSDDAEYRERKARTIERLAGYPVFEDERARIPTGAGKLLRGAVGIGRRVAASLAAHLISIRDKPHPEGRGLLRTWS